jgi:hypothetical protein
VPPSVLASVTSVEWAGTILAAHTTIKAFDPNAQSRATSVCSALSAYWRTAHKPFRTVHVLSHTGVIMMGRASLNQQFIWFL